jgi:hypothetical protein
MAYAKRGNDHTPLHLDIANVAAHRYTAYQSVVYLMNVWVKSKKEAERTYFR